MYYFKTLKYATLKLKEITGYSIYHNPPTKNWRGKLKENGDITVVFYFISTNPFIIELSGLPINEYKEDLEAITNELKEVFCSEQKEENKV